MCLHWGYEFVIKCIKCLSVSVCVYNINLHHSDRELLPETEMAVLCATMHLQPCGIMRLAGPAFFRFLFPQTKPTAYAFPHVRQKTVPLGLSGCWHGSFSSTYL